jgi:[calcium/calmodulin-dependent protein kinase] kinase
VLKKKKEHINTPTGLGYRTAYDAVIKEIGILKLLHNPNVIRLVEVIDDPECEKLYLVMEWAELGQILTWNVDELKFSPYLKDVKCLPEKQICEVIRDIAKGIKYCMITI